MQGTQWPIGVMSEFYDLDRLPAQRDLWRVAHGESLLTESFQTLTRCEEEQARTGTDLLERETWAITLLLQTSGPIWDHLPGPTLQFTLNNGNAPYHLELGRFSYLGALMGPTAEEQALVAAKEPCWARVYPHDGRRIAGQTGALACGYVPISTADAVATIGFARIYAQMEAATRAAGQALLVQAQSQHDRQVRLSQVEHMLGWDPEPAGQSGADGLPAESRLMLALAGKGHHPWLTLGLAMLGFLVATLCFFIGIPHLLLALMVAAPGLLIWKLAI